MEKDLTKVIIPRYYKNKIFYGESHGRIVSSVAQSEYFYGENKYNYKNLPSRFHHNFVCLFVTSTKLTIKGIKHYYIHRNPFVVTDLTRISVSSQ